MTLPQPRKSCPVYTLNLSEEGVEKIQIAPLEFADPPIVIQQSVGAWPISVEQVSVFGELPREGALILYILGHAVPNGLKFGPQNLIISEAAILKELTAVRGDAATLVILDACFAQSFEAIAGGAWPARFGLIFSCGAFERSWHSGAPVRQSLFSDALNRAMKECRRRGSSAPLEGELSATLGKLQVPVVTDSAYQFMHKVLGLPPY